jgi:hypothetical protein
MTTPYLKGNYSLPFAPSEAEAASAAEDLESEFERTALQKLGGSIAFVKKSGGFVWKGPARDDTR